jgi:cytochrome P450 family 628
VRTYTGRLVNHIDENQGKPFNVTEWFNCYTFDIMGDLAFGEDFAMMKRYGSGAGKHYFYHTVHQQMDIIGVFGHVPWVFPILKALPGVNLAYLRFTRWARQQIQKRFDNPPDVPDVFHWVTSEYKAIQKPTVSCRLLLLLPLLHRRCLLEA